MSLPPLPTVSPCERRMHCAKSRSKTSQTYIDEK
jgi:hypothetical protein